MREETVYYVNCTLCKKEIMNKEKLSNWQEKEFICKKCLEALPEPQRKEFNDFAEYFNEVENWSYKTKKKNSYDYDNFKSDLFAEYGVKGKKAELCYSLAYEYGHSSGLSEVLCYWQDLVELIT